MDAIYCEGGWEFETAHGGSLIEHFKVWESRITLGLRKDASPGEGQLTMEDEEESW